MEGLQRSTISFRRQGSSGIVWDDRVIAELNKQATEQKEEQSQSNEQPKPLSETSEQAKQNPNDEKEKLRPIKTGIPTMERSRSNGGGGAPRHHHRTTGRVSPAVEPPSPRLSTCGCCSAFGKKPPGKMNNPRKRPPKRRSR